MSPARTPKGRASVCHRRRTMRLRTEPRKVRTELIDIPSSRHSWRPPSRCSTTSLSNLAAQIEASGWVDAIVLRPSPNVDGRYELIDGERRLELERGRGTLTVDAIVVYAGEEDAAAITLLANLPDARVPPLAFARLAQWVAESDRQGGGEGGREAVARYLGRDPSTVSRLTVLNDGLPASMLAEVGLEDEDFEAAPQTHLARLARSRPAERRQVLHELKTLKDSGADAVALSKHLAATLPAKSKRGRPPKPFTYTYRQDGRVHLDVRKRDMGVEPALELLTDLKPFLTDLVTQAGVPSLDELLGLREAGGMSARAQRTYLRISQWYHALRALAAVKWRGIRASFDRTARWASRLRTVRRGGRGN